MRYENKSLCKICLEPTNYLGTNLCNRCWKLDTRIRNDFDLALSIVNTILLERIKQKKATDEMIKRLV